MMRNKIKSITFTIILVLIFIFTIYPQTYFNNYNGIPLVVYIWNTKYSNYDYSQLKQMGCDAVIQGNLTQSFFNKYKDVNIKIVPYQTLPKVNYITKYTDAMYTVWAAEGTIPKNGEMTFKRNSNYTVPFTEGDIKGIRTINMDSAQTYILDGPYGNTGPVGYYQRLVYKIKPSDTINYTIDFKLKIEPYGGIVDLTGNTDKVCRIEAYYKESNSNLKPICAPKDILASDFINWNTWKNFSLNYNKYNVGNVAYIYGVQFRIFFYGKTYLNLYCDNISVHDQRGYDLFNNTNGIQDSIINQAKNLNNMNRFSQNYSEFDTMVVSWYPTDETDMLDTWACVKKVNELVKGNNNGRVLMGSISIPWDGYVADNCGVYKDEEFIKRAQPDILILDKYLYSNHAAEINNIDDATRSLDKENNYNMPFFFNLQTGKWGSTLTEIPTVEKFLYSANLGLLYGAKGLAIGKYFYDASNEGSVTGLVRCSGNSNYQYENQRLWNTIRNVLSPRLKGSLGKTLKHLIQNGQYPNINVNAGNQLNYNFISKLEVIGNHSSFYVDLGFFKDPNDKSKDYFMVVNRYYSTMTNIKYTFRNLNTYSNWQIHNFITNTTSTINAYNGKAIYTDNIPLGDAAFYSVLPVVKYGGELKYNETINGTNTLLDTLSIESGATLTINGTYNANANITVDSGAYLTIAPGASLTFYNGASLKVNGTITGNGVH